MVKNCRFLEVFLIYIFGLMIGCKRCYPDRSTVLAGGQLAEQLYSATCARKAQLEQQGAKKVHEIWECKWSDVVKRNPKLREIYERCFVPPPFNPRKNALRGGRVEPFRLLEVCRSKDEILEYMDIVSDGVSAKDYFVISKKFLDFSISKSNEM